MEKKKGFTCWVLSEPDGSLNPDVEQSQLDDRTHGPGVSLAKGESYDRKRPR
ncbi:MAG: hypothetical protein JF616_22165 [Fibrobacteres bacterium]|nr:hypothetical protein [Fibrobacterota bacterium]